MHLGLEGKRAFVTGSSSGIGVAIAKALAAEGASIILHGRNAERIERVRGEIQASGGEVASVVGDLEHADECGRLAEEAVRAFGGIDILINNAGGRAPGPFPLSWFDIPVTDWVRAYNINVVSAVHLIHKLAPLMKERGWGRIVNISSLSAHMPSGSLAEYTAAKAAMNNMTLSLGRFLTRTGVTINTISPGMIRTELQEIMLEKIAEQQGFAGDKEKAAQWQLTNRYQQTVGRLGVVDDIAGMVCYIASPRSDFINGANIRVDGGASPTTN